MSLSATDNRVTLTPATNTPSSEVASEVRELDSSKLPALQRAGQAVATYSDALANPGRQTLSTIARLTEWVSCGATVAGGVFGALYGHSLEAMAVGAAVGQLATRFVGSAVGEYVAERPAIRRREVDNQMRNFAHTGGTGFERALSAGLARYALGRAIDEKVFSHETYNVLQGAISEGMTVSKETCRSPRSAFHRSDRRDEQLRRIKRVDRHQRGRCGAQCHDCRRASDGKRAGAHRFAGERPIRLAHARQLGRALRRHAADSGGFASS